MLYQPKNDVSIVYESNDDIEHARSTIPSYLKEVYYWAYLNPRNARLLDRECVVNTILWGNSKRLRRAVLTEVVKGSNVLQAAHVYGNLIPELAEKIGADGSLDVIDIAPLQVFLCKRKLKNYSNSNVRIANASILDSKQYDLVNCFFLLHEVPDCLKAKIINTLLSQVAPGGKAIFVDYNKPHKWHPLHYLMLFIFRCFEPFAESLFDNDIKNMAVSTSNFRWQKRTIFGGLYQIINATRST